MNARLKGWIAAALLAAVMLLATCMTVSEGPPVELFITINQWAAQWPATLWSMLTLLGDTSVMLLLLSPLLLFWPQVIPALLASIPLGALLSVGLKWTYHAARPAAVLAPEVVHEIGPHLTSQSFPSGHTLTGFAFVAVFWVLSARRPSGWLRIVLMLTAILVGAGVGLSRIAVGVHWPNDVLAGACAGWLAGLSGVWLSECLGRYWQSLRARVVFAVGLQMLAVWVLMRPLEFPLAFPLMLLAGLMPTATLLLFWSRRSG